MATITKELEMLIKEIGKEIENTEETLYWDTRHGLERDSKEEAFENPHKFLLELEDYNLDYRTQEEDRIGREIVDSYSEDIEHLGGDVEEVYDALIDYYPQVYFNVKEILYGEMVNVRLVLHSNYDCLLSHHGESISGYNYDSYFKDILEVLNLCPQKMKQALVSRGYSTTGRFPTFKSRHGKELVDYDQLVVELENNSSPGNLTIPISIDLYEWYQYHNGDEFKGKIKVSKGSTLGIFCDWLGGGSMIETELKEDFVVDLSKRLRDGYGRWVSVPDSSGYSMKEVYGVFDTFFNVVELID